MTLVFSLSLRAPVYAKNCSPPNRGTEARSGTCPGKAGDRLPSVMCSLGGWSRRGHWREQLFTCSDAGAAVHRRPPALALTCGPSQRPVPGASAAPAGRRVAAGAPEVSYKLGLHTACQGRAAPQATKHSAKGVLTFHRSAPCFVFSVHEEPGESLKLETSRRLECGV